MGNQVCWRAQKRVEGGAARGVHDAMHEAVEDDSQVNVAIGGDVSVHPVAAAKGGGKGGEGGSSDRSGCEGVGSEGRGTRGRWSSDGSSGGRRTAPS